MKTVMERLRGVDGEDDQVGADDYWQLLPEAIIQKIFSFLTAKKAVQTSLVCKAWYSAWSTNPILYLMHRDDYSSSSTTEGRGGGGVLDYNQIWHPHQPVRPVVEDVRREFMNYANNSFRRYQQHNLCVQELNFIMKCVCLPDSASLVQKFLTNAENIGRVKAIRCCYNSTGPLNRHALPQLFTVLEAKALIEFAAYGCKLEQCIGKTVQCCLLRKLILDSVNINEAMLESIISSCPLIENLGLTNCWGMERIRVANLHRLKHFSVAKCEKDVPVEVVETPGLESFYCGVHVKILRHNQWPIPPERFSFTLYGCKYLKKLSLFDSAIDDSYFHNLEQNFPNLEDLSVHICYGFERINISSNSLKRIKLLSNNQMKEPKINAPSMQEFRYVGEKFPRFSSCSRSKTHTSCVYDLELYASGLYASGVSCFIRLKRMLKKITINNSKVSISIAIDSLDFFQYLSKFPTFPVLQIENLVLTIGSTSSSSQSRHSIFLRTLFRSFRPKTITLRWFWEGNKKFIQFLFRRLMNPRNHGGGGGRNSYNHDDKFWEKDLKEVLKIEKINEVDGKEQGQPVSLDWKVLANDDASPTLFEPGTKIRFTLKW